MRTLLMVLILALSSSLAEAAGKIDVMEVHGPITLGLGPGYGDYRLLNSDGSWASYKGESYLGSLEVRLLNFDSSAFSIFGEYSFAKAVEPSDTSAKLEHTDFSYGIRFYPTSGFFLAVGYGNATEKITDSSTEANLKHIFTKVGMGFEMRLVGSWSLGLQGYYKTGPVTRADNTGLKNNSSYDSAEGLLMLLWSPTILNVSTR